MKFSLLCLTCSPIHILILSLTPDCPAPWALPLDHPLWSLSYRHSLRIWALVSRALVFPVTDSRVMELMKLPDLWEDSGDSAPSGGKSQHSYFPVLFKPPLFEFLFIYYMLLCFCFSHPPLGSPLPAHGNNSPCSLGVPSPPNPVSRALLAEEGLGGRSL